MQRAAASVQRAAGRGGLRKVVLVHASGDTAEVYEFGATVTSYVHRGKEVFFCGGKAIFDGNKAVRGGVPVVFPQFGQPDKAMAQHGFLRNSEWTFHVSKTGVRPDGVVQAVLVFRSSEETRKVWPHEFVAEYTVVLGPGTLMTSLKTTNLDSSGDIAPMLLLHTYYSVPQIETAQVEGLQGTKFSDKAPADGGSADGVESEDAIRFSRKCDKVYLTGSGICEVAPEPLRLKISSAPSSPLVQIDLGAAYYKSTGDVGEVVQRVKPDVVVWNPWIEMARDFKDMNDEDYKVMVCVEPGLVGENRPRVSAGDSIELSQTILPLW